LWSSIVRGVQENRIRTWSLIQGNYLTHVADQWANKAFFRPVVQPGSLLFQIVPPQGQKIPGEVYAIYHGRLIEMLLSHFPQRFSQAFASAAPVSGDSLG
jgi:hypothetical protein